MKKKAQVMMYGLMLGLAIIILTLALAPALRETTTATMNQTVGDTLGLDCSNSSISDFDKATCIATDVSMFYFIAGLLLVGGAVVFAKIIFG